MQIINTGAVVRHVPIVNSKTKAKDTVTVQPRGRIDLPLFHEVEATYLAHPEPKLLFVKDTPTAEPQGANEPTEENTAPDQSGPNN